MSYEYISNGANAGEYTAQILRGWPADGARERSELVQQGAILVNGQIVAMQSDGTVNTCASGANRNVGLVIRGNGDSSSALNANGVFMTPQPAKATTAMTWATGILTVTCTGHAYVVGNIITIAGTVTDVNSVAISGPTYGTTTGASYVILTTADANTFTVALAANPGTVTDTSGTAQLTSTANNSGKAVVLWGNYIVATSLYTASGSWVPGAYVTGTSGKYTFSAGAVTDVGFVLRVQGAVGTTPAYLVICVF